MSKDTEVESNISPLKRDLLRLTRDQISHSKEMMKKANPHFTKKEWMFYLRILQENRSGRVWCKHSGLETLFKNYQALKHEFVEQKHMDWRVFMSMYFGQPIQVKLMKEFIFPIQSKQIKAVVYPEYYPGILKPFDAHGIHMDTHDVYLGIHIDDPKRSSGTQFLRDMLEIYQKAKTLGSERFPNVKMLFLNSPLLDPKFKPIIESRTGLKEVSWDLVFESRDEYELASRVYQLMYPDLAPKKEGRVRPINPGFWIEQLN